VERPRPESKDSAARTRPHSSTSRIDVIVLTTDTALLATLREAAGPGHQIYSVESAESAVDLLVGGHCGIFVIDVAVVRRNFAELIEKLQSQFPEVVLLATGQRNEQTAVAPLVGNGRIYRFLHKPVSPARAELFLSAASRRYGDLHSDDSRPMHTVRSLASPRNFKILGSALATLIALAGAVWLWSGPQQDSQPQQVAAPSTPQPTQQLANLLAKADAAYDAGNLVPPSPGNALELYQAALQIDADNQAATVGVERIVATVETRVNDALAARDMQSARNALMTLQRIAPAHPRLATLQTALTTASRTTAVAQSRASTVSPVASAPTQAQVSPATSANTPVMAARNINPNTNLAKAFLAANRLIEPPEASALGLLRRARESGESDGAVQITATDLGTRLLNNALAAVDAGDAANARISHAAAVSIDREFETSLPDLDLVTERIRDLERAAQRAKTSSLLERATRLRLGGRLLEPGGDNAFEVLRAALAEDPSSAEARAEQQRLSFALLESTRTSLAAGDIDRADVLVGRAEEISPGLQQTRALRERIGSARAQREEATSVVQAASLPRRREVPAVYPRDALLDRVEGWVDLEFTISEEGVPIDVKVKAAQPARVFDIAASQALRQWRFEPIIRDGAPRARRATLRMEFRLKA
jgi:TonB family protein